MKIHSKVIELTAVDSSDKDGVEWTVAEAQWEPPEGAVNVSASTHISDGTPYLVLTWGMPSAEELTEMKLAAARQHSNLVAVPGTPQRN